MLKLTNSTFLDGTLNNNVFESKRQEDTLDQRIIPDQEEGTRSCEPQQGTSTTSVTSMYD